MESNNSSRRRRPTRASIILCATACECQHNIIQRHDRLQYKRRRRPLTTTAFSMHPSMIATIILLLSSSSSNRANGDNLRKLQSSQSYLTSLYPYLPSHPQKTCTNTAQPQQWEISSASITLDECCYKHFSWDTYTCEVEGKKLNATNYYKWQQEQYQQGISGEGEESGPTPAPSRPTHPYIVNYVDETCYNDAPLPYNPNTNNEEIVGYTTLKQCCGSELRHIMSKCMSLGIKAYNILMEQYNAEDEGLPLYMPNWSLYKCDRSQIPNEWDVTYNKLKDCCDEHFNWNLDDCLNSASSGQGLVLDGSSNNNNEEETTYWYPIWSSSHCTTNHLQSPPTYMLDDPSNTMQLTYIECCTINFQNEQWTNQQNEESLTTCLELSKDLGPPTMQPTDIPDDTLKTIYYPDYTSDKCLINGNYAPSYMKDDISTYFSITAGECCRIHFPTIPKKTCVQNSDSAVNNNDSTIITSNGNIVNPYHYKFTYYPILKNVICIMNIDIDAPSYMYDSTSVFFTSSIGECCTNNYPDLEVEICVENSNMVELGHSLSDVTTNEGWNDEPSILVKFTCKLYFRNVYIPRSSTDHLVTIKNVVTNAVKSVLKDEFRVVNVNNVNFDGIDINNGDDHSINGDDGLESKGLRQRQLQTTSSQQLFTFKFDISYTCNEDCQSDITNAGKVLSQSVISIFDEAMSYNSIYNMIISDMNSMGYVGPFASSTLNEGFIVMDDSSDVIMDPMYTSSPTMSLPPTTSPTTRKPSMKPTPSSHNTIGTLYYPDLDKGTCVTAENDLDIGLQPNLFPSLDECCSFDWLDYTTCIVQADHVSFLYYPDLDKGTCINDGNEGPLQPNLFNTLDECCSFEWLEYDTCLSNADVNQTPEPTPPSPTLSPSTSTPSRAPSARPSKVPTKKPSPFKPSQTDWPTFSPSSSEPTGPDPTKRPTRSPTKKPVDCIGMGWHVDHIKTDGCSNNDNYLEIWLMPHLKDQMFHPTAQACCDAFFADDCVIYDICAPDDDDGDSPSDSDVTDPVTLPPPEEEIDKTGEVCKYGWHVHKLNNDGCTNNEDIVEAWTSPQLIDRMFYSDHASCCDVFFPNQACQKYDTGCLQA